MARRIIEIIALLLGIVLTIGVVIAIPLKSYNEYKDYLAEVERQNEANKQQAIKPVLESITAELKEGIVYFANDLAEVRPEHFIVTANYIKEGEEPWSEIVEEDDFTINSPSDFYAKGGTITIKYKGVATELQIALEPVVLEEIKISVNPYTIKYQAGSTFDGAGMTVTAFYNDGSSKILADDQYVVDEKVLAIGDTTVAVSFTDGEITKTADVAIGVSETLDNGAVESIIIVDDAIVYAGQPISTAAMEVNAVYENGNRRPLASDEYTIDADFGAVEFGKMYHLTVSYNADPTKTAKTDIKVRQTVQGEDGIIVGGSKKTEEEYAIIDGVITKLDNSVTFAGNFAGSVLKGDDANLTLVINSAAETVGDITVRCGNSYLVYFNGTNKNDGYIMKPLQINTILDLTINGREVKVPSTVILRGCGPYAEYPPLYGIYYEFTFEGVQLDAGVNNVKFDFKKSTIGANTCWNESPSTLNIDYVHFDTYGSEIPDEYTIAGIEIQSNFAPSYGQRFDQVNVPVVAILSDGTKIGISSDLCNFEFIGGYEGDTTFRAGKYTVIATMKDDPTITASMEFEVAPVYHFVVLTAGVELVGDRVHYVFTGESLGYKADQIELFDGGTIYPITVELDDIKGTFKLYVDATDAGYGTTYWPHLRLDGENYDNGGANDKGDVRDRGLKFTDGQSVIYNGKIYTIVNQYSMPTLKVEKHADIPVIPDNPNKSYDANIDNSYVSDKVLIGEYVYSSPETETTGTDKGDEYPGGIGNLDQPNKFVTYTFTLDAAGKVDFIWNIAGSKWNGSGNDGIANAADHMTVVIDGVAVDMEGIVLPAGTGSTEWWNIQQVVILNVELEAGTHTFTCLITTKDSGINGGAMEIYSSSAIAHVHTEVEIPAVEADCTKPGSTAGVKCSECGEILVAPTTIPQKAHTEQEIPAVDATCTTPGSTAGVKCSACGATLTAPTAIPETGHSFDHNLDADCNNGCGFVRDVECKHSFTGPVLEGTDGFYQKCDNEHCNETQAASTPVADSYKATIDNEFDSDKANTLSIIYGKYKAWGVDTNGDYKDETGAPAGAIGGLDKAGKYVTYQFTLDKAGTVDFIWNIAGSKWNGSGNDGLADMSAYMTITIDGKPVDISGLALPAGTGSTAWWNLQQFVINGVALEAGTHTFSCSISTNAGGLNVGPMVIQSNKTVNARSAKVTHIDLVEKNGRLYYAFTMQLNGYSVEDIKLWGDNGNYTVDHTENGENGAIIVMYDISDLAIGTSILPHMSLADKNYVNGKNNAGDVREDIIFEAGSVKYGDKYYVLSEQYSMPSVSVVQAVASISSADLIVENDKVYYTLTYEVIGYDPASFEFFDGNTVYPVESIVTNGNYVTFKLNVSDNPVDIWPHLRIEGKNFDGNKGDVLLTVATKSVTHGGKVYTLKTQYSMPTLVVTNA